MINALQHYDQRLWPQEHESLCECEFQIRNIGWTLGNECPYRCTHCYSMSARVKGRDMDVEMVDRIVDQLVRNGIETVNLGGNEPLFTNGKNPHKSVLPYVIEKLTDNGILVGLTTAGVTLTWLAKHRRETVQRLNDIDVSFDSPFQEEHNRNRGANLYAMAMESLQIAGEFGIPRSVIMCGMSWNFSPRHLFALVDLAREYDAHVRINPLKPVEAEHLESELSPEMYYEGFRILMNLCTPVDLGEPPVAAVSKAPAAKGCPCGRSSFRIHSITPDGTVPVSPCVYLHEYKAGNILEEDLYDIIRSPEFRLFRRRNGNPQVVEGCDGCDLLRSCRGGCAARSYLANLHRTQQRSLFARDPYCPKEHGPHDDFPKAQMNESTERLVHQDYLCTWIGKPKIGTNHELSATSRVGVSTKFRR